MRLSQAATVGGRYGLFDPWIQLINFVIGFLGTYISDSSAFQFQHSEKKKEKKHCSHFSEVSQLLLVKHPSLRFGQYQRTRKDMFGEDESGSRQLSPDIQTRFPVPGQESAKKDKMMLVISGAGPVAQPMNYQAAGLPTFQLAPGFSSSTLNPLPIPHHSPGNVLHLHSRPTQPLTVVSALPLFTQASTSPQRQLPLAGMCSLVVQSLLHCSYEGIQSVDSDARTQFQVTGRQKAA